MKHDNSVEKLRGPKVGKLSRFLSERIFSYDEMLQGSADCDDLFSIEIFAPSKKIYHRTINVYEASD